MSVDLFLSQQFIETVCYLYHQKKVFISVPYEPKNADYLKKELSTSGYEEEERGIHRGVRRIWIP